MGNICFLFPLVYYKFILLSLTEVYLVFSTPVCYCFFFLEIASSNPWLTQLYCFLLFSGTFTNQIQTAFREPRLLIVADTRADHQPITESSYANIPVMAFCNVDSPTR